MTEQLIPSRSRYGGVLRSAMFVACVSTIATPCDGQWSDTLRVIDIEEVTVTAYRSGRAQETAFQLIPVSIDSLAKEGTYNLSDLVARTPGLDILSSGIGISKPVIRGLSGNRVLILLSGLKFDNQQWQEEHGLGLSDLGLSRVEIIKGPMSVLYGSEAIGGVINLIEEEPPVVGTRATDASVRFHSNTLGGLIEAGTRANSGKHWYRLRIGIENHGDYSDGRGDRVLNSRFDGYYLKGSYGIQRRHWISENHFSSAFNRFGFIFNDVYTFIQPDARWSRNLSAFPTHLVLLNMFNSENTFALQNGSRLNVNLGVQSNKRMENEGGGAISLDMHLLTAQYLIKWETDLNARHTLVLSHLASFEDNTNFGARKIVPDANLQEANVSVYLKSKIGSSLIWENGIGGGEKWIKTFFTPLLHGPGKEIQPFSKLEPYYNFFTGLSYAPVRAFLFKFNIATGVRIPNLAELASDGLHEGVFTYEIGNPDLENEQNLAFNLSGEYRTSVIALTISPFYNLFSNYVYLAPTAEEWFGFPVYRYLQQDAHQYGGEARIETSVSRSLTLACSYSGMISETDDGRPTPFTPEQELIPRITGRIPLKGTSGLSAFAEFAYHFAQDNVYPEELPSESYVLCNAGIQTEINSKTLHYVLSVSCHNLLNEAYTDHLSRFKSFGLLNPGRDLSVRCKVFLESKLHD